jgi:octaprenyl-diphosphate synthase
MATTHPLLETIYREIGADLELVEDRMREVLASERLEIAEMVSHASSYGGKRLRPALVLLTARSVGETVSSRHRELATVVELVHLATLVHDDIIDGAALRRGAATANARWSNYEAVLLGDIIFSRAINLLSQMGDRRALMALTAAVSTLCEGEILQNRHRHDVALGEEAYYDIIGAKTGALFGTGCELAAYLSGASVATTAAFSDYGLQLGLAFQIIDDCLDLTGNEMEVGKSLGTDLDAGKMTLPLILLRDRLPSERRGWFERVMGSPAAPSPADATKLRSLLREYGTVEESIDRARGHVEAALAGIRHAVPPELGVNLEAVADFVLGRRL